MLMEHPSGAGPSTSLRASLDGFLVLGQEDWDEIWRRNQFLIAGLARRFPATRFLFVELPFDLTYSLRSGQIFRRGSPARYKLAQWRHGLRSVPDIPNIAVFVPPKVLPATLRLGDRINRRIQIRGIK